MATTTYNQQNLYKLGKKVCVFFEVHVLCMKSKSIGQLRMTGFEIQKGVKIISILHVCMVWIEKSATRVTDRHHEAC